MWRRCTALLLCLSLLTGATFTWTNPTTRTDGSSLTNHAGTRLYCGTASGGPYGELLADIPTPAETHDEPPANVEGKWCVGTAYDADGFESAFSNEASLETTPPQVQDLTVQLRQHEALVMAISFVGSAEGGTGNGLDVTLTLPAMQEGDLVIVAGGVGDNDNIDLDMAMVTAGYTEVADLFANDSLDCNLGVFWKVMGATPDTTAVFDGVGGTDAGVAAVAMVFRGVDTTTPMDVTPTTATALNTMHPDPPSIDFLDAAAWTVIAGASGHNLGAGTYTFPTGYVTDALEAVGDDTGGDVTVGVGYRTNPADPEDPGVMTHSGIDSVSYAWCAVTMALRPAAAGGITEADGSASGSSIVSSVAAAIFAGVTAAVGTAADAVAGTALWLAVATAPGVATVDAPAVTILEGVGASAGVATDAVVGTSLFAGVGASAGVASDASVSGATAQVEAVSAGIATVSGDGEDAGSQFTEADGSASGVATATGISTALWNVIAESEGLSVVSGAGEDAAAPAGPAPAGTVAVRYLLGQIPNVVPVETVLTSEAGVVPVREFVGPANVVPVRETATETPRVKVRKV